MLIYVVPTLRSWSGTALVIDISGDIEKNVQTLDKVVIEPYNENTARYDVLYSIDNATSINEQNEHLQALSFALIPLKPTTDDTSAFYQEESRKLLQSALVAFYHAGLDFVPICKQILSVSAEFLLADINASRNELAMALAAGFEGGSEKTLAATKQEIDKAIILFATNSSVADAIGRGGISTATLESKSIFLNIPDEKLELLSPFLRLIVAQTLSFISARENYKNPKILLCLDEFASLGKMEITPALLKFRKKNCSVMALLQSLASLDAIYGITERKVMMDNFAFKVVMGANEPDTQEYFSKLAGERIAIRASRTETAEGSNYTESEYREKRIQPEEFGRLRHHLILFHAGGVLKLRKNYFYKRWLW